MVNGREKLNHLDVISKLLKPSASDEIVIPPQVIITAPVSDGSKMPQTVNSTEHSEVQSQIDGNVMYRK